MEPPKLRAGRSASACGRRCACIPRGRGRRSSMNMRPRRSIWMAGCDQRSILSQRCRRPEPVEACGIWRPAIRVRRNRRTCNDWQDAEVPRDRARLGTTGQDWRNHSPPKSLATKTTFDSNDSFVVGESGEGQSRSPLWMATRKATVVASLEIAAPSGGLRRAVVDDHGFSGG
jgi:hypothetical protein